MMNIWFILVSAKCIQRARLSTRSRGSEPAGMALFDTVTVIALIMASDTAANPKTGNHSVRISNDYYYDMWSVIDGVSKVDSSLGQALEEKVDDFRNK
jgi:hypothetical protein